MATITGFFTIRIVTIIQSNHITLIISVIIRAIPVYPDMTQS